MTALADSVKMAQRRAYEIAEQIHFDGCQMRHDIGYRAINHTGNSPWTSHALRMIADVYQEVHEYHATG